MLCHLIENEFGHYSPPPAYFFYRRTAGITDPDVCVKSLYASLLEAHGIEESEESQRQNSPEAVYHKLVNLLSQSIAPRLAPSRPQLIFIDALDEAEATPSGATAYQRIPENLPASVYVIATARQVRDKAFLARRSHLECYDLDSPDLLQENLRDGVEFVERELAASKLPSETLGEIARVGRGNFLVLKHMCGHVRSRLNPDEVGTYLSRLATAPAADQLGFIYEEFWEPDDPSGNPGRAAMPGRRGWAAHGGTDSRSGGVDLPRAGLAGWHVGPRVASGSSSTLRSRPTPRSRRARPSIESTTSRLPISCDTSWQPTGTATSICWPNTACDGRSCPPVTHGYMRRRFGPAHLMATKQWDAVETLLTNLDFLEAKTEAGLVFELAGDFQAAIRVLPEEPPRRRTSGYWKRHCDGTSTSSTTMPGIIRKGCFSAFGIPAVHTVERKQPPITSSPIGEWSGGC